MITRDPPARDRGIRFPGSDLGQGVEDGLTVARDHRVEEHEVSDALGDRLGHTGDDHSGVAVSHQDGGIEVFKLEEVDDVLDVRGQRGLGCQQVSPLPKTGQGWRVGVDPA